jgi:hypothetical protein
VFESARDRGLTRAGSPVAHGVVTGMRSLRFVHREPAIPAEIPVNGRYGAIAGWEDEGDELVGHKRCRAGYPAGRALVDLRNRRSQSEGNRSGRVARSSNPMIVVAIA